MPFVKKDLFLTESHLIANVKPLFRRTSLTRPSSVPRPKCRANTRPFVEDIVRVEDASPFLEPLIRSVFFGFGVGAACEVYHTFANLYAYLHEAALVKLNEVVPGFVQSFSPWFLADHVAAIAVSALVYTIEVWAVLRMVQQDALPSVVKALPAWVSLPKRVFPCNIVPVKHLVSRIVLGVPPSQKVQSSAIPVDSLFRSEIPVATTLVPKQTKFTLPPPADEAQTELEKSWMRRKKELVERDSYLTNFWYAAALSEKLTNEPMSVEILGMKIVLFRDELGRVQCLKDVCPHRSAPLSQGWMHTRNGKKCLVCPYHGWEFDSSGSIEHIPTTDNIPKLAKAQTFVVEELGGFIWLFYEHPTGPRLPAEERPPIPMIPEFLHPNWRATYAELEFNCGHFSVFENAMDLAHIHYLHGDSFGNPDKPRIENLIARKDAFGVHGSCAIHNKAVSPLWKFAEVDEVPVEAHALLPSTSVLKISLGIGIEFITFVNTVPIDQHRSINRFALLRNFLPWPSKVWDPWARKAMIKILTQDKAMIEKVAPHQSITDVSVDVDIIQTLFRRLRQDYISMGYGFHPVDDIM